jgi:nucleoside-diphosphate-sugar epimerase
MNVRRVLVTHVDTAVGRRLAKALYHDPDVGLVLGLGTGPAPSFLEAYAEKCVYQRLDLAKARHVVSFFHSELFARARLDSVVHLPFVHERSGERIPGNVSSLVSETRRLLEAVKRERGIERFVYLSSGFVYRPEPGNVNLVTEEQLLDFDAEADPEVRAWIDADLVCQKELNDSHLRVTILRSATVVSETGEFLLSPPLERPEPQLGFDPMLSLVSDKDVARALVLALHGDRPGIYNVAGREIFPRSELGVRPTGFGPLPLPAALAGVLSLAARAFGIGARGEAALQRYGLVLDTHLVAEALGFEPQYRIEVTSQRDGRRIDTVRCR